MRYASGSFSKTQSLNASWMPLLRTDWPNHVAVSSRAPSTEFPMVDAMGEMKQGPYRSQATRTVMSSTRRNHKFAFLASYRLALAQAQVALPVAEQGWMRSSCAPHVPTWQEFFQLMRRTPGVCSAASRQMESFLDRCAIGYTAETGERQGGSFHEAFATIAAEARRMLEPEPQAMQRSPKSD